MGRTTFHPAPTSSRGIGRANRLLMLRAPPNPKQLGGNSGGSSLAAYEQMPRFKRVHRPSVSGPRPEWP